MNQKGSSGANGILPNIPPFKVRQRVNQVLSGFDGHREADYSRCGAQRFAAVPRQRQQQQAREAEKRHMHNLMFERSGPEAFDPLRLQR